MPIGLNREFCWYHCPQNSVSITVHRILLVSLSTEFCWYHCPQNSVGITVHRFLLVSLSTEFCWHHCPQNSVGITVHRILLVSLSIEFFVKEGHFASTHFQHFEDTDIKVRYELSKLQSSLYVPPGLTLKNLTFHPHSCIYVFCVDLRTNSHYFPIQH